MSSRTKRRHTDEYKKEAIELSHRIGIAKAARQLSIAESLLYTWRKKYSDESNETPSEERKEINRLKRLLADKEEELAIVKKAAKYFAKESR